MSILHLTQVQYCGLICLTAGAVMLVTGFYLYEADLQFYERLSRMPTNSPYPTPIELPTYYYIQPIFTEVGAVLFCAGVFLLSYKQIRNKTKTRPK